MEEQLSAISLQPSAKTSYARFFPKSGFLVGPDCAGATACLAKGATAMLSGWELSSTSTAMPLAIMARAGFGAISVTWPVLRMRTVANLSFRIMDFPFSWRECDGPRFSASRRVGSFLRTLTESGAAAVRVPDAVVGDEFYLRADGAGEGGDVFVAVDFISGRGAGVGGAPDTNAGD